MMENPPVNEEIQSKLENQVPLISLMESYCFEHRLSLDNKSKIDSVAQVLIEFFHFCTIIQTNELLVYTGKIYSSSLAETTVAAFTEKLIPNCRSPDTNEVIQKIKRRTQVDISKFDEDSRYVVVENGIIDLETMEISEHTKNHYSRILIPMSYQKPESMDIEKNLENTKFWKYLTSCHTYEKENEFGITEKIVDKKTVMTCLETMASVFVRESIDEKAIFLIGTSENGKSTFQEYVEKMIGQNNRSELSIQQITTDKHLVAGLDQKMLNSVPDSEVDLELKNISIIKKVVSGESFTVRHSHGKPFSLNPICKMLFSANGLPRVKNYDKAFFRRWIIIFWNRSFENSLEKDPLLKKKLKEDKEEMSKVFSNIIWISSRLWKSGKFSFSQDSEEIKKIWLEQSNPEETFALKHTAREQGNLVSRREMWEIYCDFMERQGRKPLDIGRFSMKFENYYDKKDKEKVRYWQDVTLVDSDNPESITLEKQIEFENNPQSFINKTKPEQTESGLSEFWGK